MTLLVAGAGPAGSRLAERVAQQGIPVVLVDPLKAAEQNIFSSAAVPIEALTDLNIPDEAVSSYWHGWQLVDPQGRSHQWFAARDLGVVLDFGALRKQLWLKAQQAGVELLLGWRVKSVISRQDGADVELQGPGGLRQTRSFEWVVDATGHHRSLIGAPERRNNSSAEELLEGFGMEWILQADKNSMAVWSQRLTFFLGCHWMPHGYGWIFPMANQQLKVGVCRLSPKSKPGLASLSSFLKRLISENQLNTLPILDRHGGVLSSTIGRREAHSRGRIVAVGDAVSTANLLGGEGIRHALRSAELLAPFLVALFESAHQRQCTDQKLLLEYENLLRRRLGWRWNLSGRLAKRTWWGLCDQRADRRLSRLIDGLSQRSSAEDLSALLFEYRFERYGLRLLPYLMGWR